MDNNALIFQILGVLAVLFFIFITYMNTKTWHWPHVTFLFLVLPAGATAMVYTALSLKTRAVWMAKAKQLEPELETTLANIQQAREGAPGDLERKTSYTGMRDELNRIIVNRGRVWRGCQPTVNGDGTITLAIAAPAADPLNPQAAAAPSKHNIEAQLVLHAFSEFDQDGIRVPRVYLGEFTVNAAAETSIAVAPRLPLSQSQLAAVNQPGTWTLYELAPVDSHELLTGKDENELRQLLPQAETGLDNVAYAEFLKPYLRDGKDADEAADSPENIWLEVKFIKTHKAEVDAPQAIHVFENLFGGPFDDQGRALYHRLRNAPPGEQPEPVQFEPGQIGLFPKQQAEGLINAQVAEKVRAVYRRPLIDFENGFDNLYARTVQLNLRLRSLNREIATAAVHNQAAADQAALLEQHKAMLESDQADAQKNKQALDAYLATLTTKLQGARDYLSRLYADNRRLHAELSAITGKLTEDIDRRTRAAASGAQ